MRSFLPVGVKNYFEKPSQQFFKSRLNFHVKWFYENFAMILPLQAPGHTQTLNCKNVDTSKTWSKNDETKRFSGKCLCRYKISSHLSPFTKSFISRRTWIASIIHHVLMVGIVYMCTWRALGSHRSLQTLSYMSMLLQSIIYENIYDYQVKEYMVISTGFHKFQRLFWRFTLHDSFVIFYYKHLEVIFLFQSCHCVNRKSK